MYELECGSIFDKKCELIIIPCNSMGGISNSMRNDLMVNDITNHPYVGDWGREVKCYRGI